MQEKILKVAVNKNCLNKSNPQLVARGWSNVLVNVEWLMGWVQAGYGWCATHFHEKHRKSDNAAGSNLIVIDFDGDTSLQKFWAAPTAKEWCVATYTSASHTEGEHRFRALFPLGKDLDTTAQHRGAYWLIVNRLLADLGLKELKDNCGQKPERLWYGNQNAVVQYNDGAVVPDFLLTDIDYDEPAEFNSSDCEEIDIRRCQWLLQEFLRPIGG